MAEFGKYRNPDSAYKVPDSYFQEKRRDLLDIPAKHADKGGKVFRLSAGWIASGIAAAMLLGLFIFGPNEDVTNITSDDFSREEISEFVLTSYNYELTEEILILELDEEDVYSLEAELLTDEELEIIIDENYDQILHYEYL